MEDEEGLSEEEFAKVLARATAETELNHRVAEQRPSASLLGRFLDIHVDLVEALIGVRVAEQVQQYDARGEPVVRLDDAPWWPEVESPAATENQLLVTAGWPPAMLRQEDEDDQSRVVKVARRFIECAIDHLRAIAILMQDGRSVRAPVALSRVALEAAAHAHHLLDPGITPSERTIRCLNEELMLLAESVRASARDAEGDGEGDGDGEGESNGDRRTTKEECEIDKILSVVKRLEPTRSASWRPQDRPTADRPGRLPHVKPFVGTSAMIDTALEGGGGQFWSRLSAVVHNQEDTAFRVMFALQMNKNQRDRDKSTVLNVLPALIVFSEVIERLGAFMNWDMTEAESKDEVSRWAIGAGLADDQIRRQLLAEDGSTD